MNKKIIESKKAPTPIGPYSQAVMANNMLFVSGQISLDPTTGKLIKTDIQSETLQVMKNIQAIIHEAGLDFKHIVKSTIFITNMDDFGKINEVYGSFFVSNSPARETIQVVRLPKGANVEISVIACVN